MDLVGKICTVSEAIPPGGEKLGEVVVEIRGGTGAYSACSSSTTETMTVNTKAVVVDELPGRVLVVAPYA